MIKETMYSGLGVYLSALKLLNENNFEKVVLFNGRFVNDAAIAAACERMGVPVEYHERGAKPDRFKLVPFPVHDRKNTRKLIDEFWNKNLGNRENSEKIARIFLLAELMIQILVVLGIHTREGLTGKCQVRNYVRGWVW